MAKQPKPDCKVGDTLRIEKTLGWSGWASAMIGDTALVVNITDKVILAIPDKDPGETSSWWRHDRENQPRFTVIKEVSDEDIETTKLELQQLLKQL